jgi:hypothetical protein
MCWLLQVAGQGTSLCRMGWRQYLPQYPAAAAAAPDAAAALPYCPAEVGEAPVPVAQAQVGGSPWYEVKCSDGRRYFFNHTTHETAWSMPPEVRLCAALVDMQVSVGLCRTCASKHSISYPHPTLSAPPC